MSNSTEEIIALVNDTNSPPKLLTPLLVRFNEPVEETGEGWDTRVMMRANPGKGYRGNVEIFYTRVPLADLGAAPTMRSETGFTKDSLINALNGMLNAFITPDDLEPFEIPELAVGETKVVSIIAKENSLGWRGSADVVIQYGRPYLPAVVHNRKLGAMVHPNVDVNKVPYGKWLSDKFDFTSFRDALAPVKEGYPSLTDPNAVLTVCRKLGFPAFWPYYVSHGKTSQVPDSNQNFTHVAVVHITGGNMVTPMYFHYNAFDEV